MPPPAAGLEQRLGDLETQIERLTLALLRWRESEEHRQPSERRLHQLTEQCADVLDQWTATSERHAHAVTELESRLTAWHDMEGRLQQDASARFQGLERTVEREWASLRQLHEEPVRQLREHAETLTEISMNAAGSAQTGIERAEARLAALEHDLHRRIDDLSRDIHTVLAEIRQHGAPALRSPASSWSLDEVTRLHHELRDGAATLDQPAVFDASTMAASNTGFTAPPATLLGAAGEPARDARVPHAVDVVSRPDPDPAIVDAASSRTVWMGYAAVAAAVLAIAAAIAFALSFYSQANRAAERAAEAQQRADRIATTANERIDAARRDAAAQIDRARDAASKAQVTTDVLAAPDLVRFNLVGGDATARLSAQLLWSRSRGMVFTAARIPPPAAGSLYQLWLLTAGDPVSAGTVVPDAAGRISLTSDTPPSVPRPIVGVRVTLEPAPGRAAPSGPTVLARLQ